MCKTTSPQKTLQDRIVHLPSKFMQDHLRSIFVQDSINSANLCKIEISPDIVCKVTPPRQGCARSHLHCKFLHDQISPASRYMIRSPQHVCARSNLPSELCKITSPQQVVQDHISPASSCMIRSPQKICARPDLLRKHMQSQACSCENW